MKKLLFLSIICFGLFANAADDKGGDSIKRQSAEGYSDESAFETQNPDVGAVRKPNGSGDLPYSDDEIQQNSPENYKGKNMPIDQD